MMIIEKGIEGQIWTGLKEKKDISKDDNEIIAFILKMLGATISEEICNPSISRKRNGIVSGNRGL